MCKAPPSALFFILFLLTAFFSGCRKDAALPRSVYPGKEHAKPVAYVRESERLFRSGELRQASHLLKKHMVELANREEAADAYFQAAFQSFFAGDNTLALERWEAGWTLSQSEEDRSSTGWWAWLLGAMLAERGEEGIAHLLCQRTLEFAVVAEDLSLQARCLSCLGQLEKRKATSSQALVDIPFFENALDLAWQAKDTTFAIHQQLQIAQAFFLAGEKEKGDEMLDRTARILEGHFCEPLRLVFQSMNARWRTKDPDRATTGEDPLKSYLAKAEEMGFTALQREIYIWLALESMEQGAFEESQILLHKAWKLDTSFLTAHLQAAILQWTSGQQEVSGFPPLLRQASIAAGQAGRVVEVVNEVDRMVRRAGEEASPLLRVGPGLLPVLVGFLLAFGLGWWLRRAPGRVSLQESTLLIAGPPALQEGDVEEAVQAEEEPNEEDSWMEELKAGFEADIHQFEYTVDDLAKQANMSRRQFYRKMKEATGMTPHQLIKQWRFDTARRWLQQGKYKSVKEVSYAVGMKNVEYFSRLYRDHFGVLPSDDLQKMSK